MNMGINKKLASWMAIFAILFAFFSPTVSEAMSADNHSNVIYQKICSDSGIKSVPVQMPSGKHQDDSLSHIGHCAFCCTSNQTPVINSDPAVAVLSLNESQVLISPAYDSPVVQFTYQVSNSPQAPPAI